MSVSVTIEIIFGQLLLLVTLNILLTNGFFDATFDPSQEVSFDLFPFDIFVKDKLKLDFLRQLVELELPVVTQVRRWEKWVKNDLEAVVENFWDDTSE